MLTPEEEQRLDAVIKNANSHIKHNYLYTSISSRQLKEIAEKLKEMNNQMKEYQDCCLHEGDCKFGEELPNADS
jgi:hypothetical protein